MTAWWKRIPRGLPVRARAAIVAMEVVNRASRIAKRGAGTVAGGKVALTIAPSLLSDLSASRRVVLVSATNGKTTTSRLLAAAIEAGGHLPVALNATGSNMTAGHVAALVSTPQGAPAVLETDEAYLPVTLAATRAAVCVLGNLSRDQLDRTSEVRMLASRWRDAFVATPTVVVANCDDPLVVYGAETAAEVIWVTAGMNWRNDATGCPRCAGRITYIDDGSGQITWHCTCGFTRPQPTVTVLASAPGTVRVRTEAGDIHEGTVGLPGAFNASNAVLAAVAASVLGVDLDVALKGIATVDHVAGRFAERSIGGRATTVMLAKNPAGWAELLNLVADDTAPLVVAINARTADGRDPSWLWDVPFEQLRGRTVIAAGERRFDLGVRLLYADVDFEVVANSVDAVRTARGDGVVHFIGNYTAFADLGAVSA